jgi:hypothetical protein
VAAFNARQYDKAAARCHARRAARRGGASAALGLAAAELGRPGSGAALRAALEARPDDATIRDNLARWGASRNGGRRSSLTLRCMAPSAATLLAAAG